jgi:ankyrin repeat protein
VKALLAAGAAVNEKDSDGWTALMYAARDGRPAIAQLLLTAGADVKVKNSQDKTALTLAMERSRSDIIELLKSRE